MRLVKTAISLLYISLIAGAACAQPALRDARRYATEKDYKKANEIYADLYKQSPDSVYDEYLESLLLARDCRTAEKMVEKKAAALKERNIRDLSINFDLGSTYTACGKDEKAHKQFDSVVAQLNGDDILTTRVAKQFMDLGQGDYAIKTYERALQLLGNPPMYGRQLAMLYAGKGDMENCVEALLRGGPTVFMTPDQAKELLLEIVGKDSEKLRQVQKAIIKKINKEPGNNYYGEILTWIYTQKDDWDGALIQIEAIDERNGESGRRVMDLARQATLAGQYEMAMRAYDDVIAKGKDLPYYAMARAEKLQAGLKRIAGNPERKIEDINALAALYDSFFVEFPYQYTLKPAGEFAELLAVYGNDVNRAINVLNKSINDPATRRNVLGLFKLQLGDYYLLAGRVWDASLTYSQVDKEFKQDVMGDDARFRNARLAFYQGDFDLAQKQLGIVKSGTSNLIANDAIDLSVLITENVEDSNTVALERFATAGLLLFQNRDSAAVALVDSIEKAFPKHPLDDDLVMFRAKVAVKHRQFPEALKYYAVIMDKYKEDVLADDATFQTAEIYQNELHQPAEAKKFYEDLIINFPGSTFVQTARQKLSEMEGQHTQ